MNTDTKESRSVSAGGPVFLRAKLSLDQTPTKPFRRSSNIDGYNETEKIIFTSEDESNNDLASVFSDITDPSVFGGGSVNNSSLDGGSVRTSLRISLRVDTLGPLHEEMGSNDSLELLFGEDIPSPPQDRAAFETNHNDTPPKLAKRMYTSCTDLSVDSQPMKDRFEEIAPCEKDKPITKPIPCY